MAEYGFGDQSSYFQREAILRGGLRVECGEFTDCAPTREAYSHTHFSRLVVGLGIGDITDGVRCRAKSICDGQLLCWTMNDVSCVHWNYIAFGF
jgi:hypothetical protein